MENVESINWLNYIDERDWQQFLSKINADYMLEECNVVEDHRVGSFVELIVNNKHPNDDNLYFYFSKYCALQIVNDKFVYELPYNSQLNKEFFVFMCSKLKNVEVNGKTYIEDYVIFHKKLAKEEYVKNIMKAKVQKDNTLKEMDRISKEAKNKEIDELSL